MVVVVVEVSGAIVSKAVIGTAVFGTAWVPAAIVVVVVVFSVGVVVVDVLVLVLVSVVSNVQHDRARTSVADVEQVSEVQASHSPHCVTHCAK